MNIDFTAVTRVRVCVCDGCTFTSEAPAQHAAEISDKQEGNDDSDSFTNTWSAALTLLHFFFPKEDFNRKEIKRVTLFQRKSSFSFRDAWKGVKRRGSHAAHCDLKWKRPAVSVTVSPHVWFLRCQNKKNKFPTFLHSKEICQHDCRKRLQWQEAGSWLAGLSSKHKVYCFIYIWMFFFMWIIVKNRHFSCDLCVTWRASPDKSVTTWWLDGAATLDGAVPPLGVNKTIWSTVL